MNEAAFLDALAADPLDGVTRRVYADWLEERGDPRAEYLRREIELADIPIDDPRWPALACWVRERVDAHDPAWVAAACPLYEVWLHGYPEGEKLPAIHVVYAFVRVGIGLDEAKALIDSVPSRILAGVPFAAALRGATILLANLGGDPRRATIWPCREVARGSCEGGRFAKQQSLDLTLWQGLRLSRPDAGHAASGSMPS